MSWYTIFYFFSMADKINLIFSILAGVSGAALGITLIVGLVHTDSYSFKENDWKIWRRCVTIFGIIGFISLSCWTFTPSKKDLLLIVAGGSVGQFVSNDKNAKEIPTDIAMFLRKEILEATAELKEPEVMKEILGVETLADQLKKKSKEELIKLLQEKEETPKTK